MGQTGWKASAFTISPYRLDYVKTEGEIMSENVENLILEHLRGVRGSVDKLVASTDELRVRISSLEGHVAGLRRDISLVHDDIAAVHLRLDHHEERLSRIE